MDKPPKLRSEKQPTSRSLRVFSTFFVFVSLKAKRSQLKYQEKNSIFVCEIIFEERREGIRFCYVIKLEFILACISLSVLEKFQF